MKRIILVIMVLNILLYRTSLAQVKATDGIRVFLNDDGSHYLKWTFLNQVWLRFNQSNPGTLVMGVPARSTWDIGLRRTRVQFFGQVTDHVFFYTQFGHNNFNFLSQNAGNRKLQVFFHDALCEYKVWKESDWLKLGAGLTIANGLSRFSQPSVGTIMTMDVPVFAQATVDQTDEFSRKLSVYARGQAGRLDYRLVVSDPFPVTTSGAAYQPPAPAATFAARGHHKQYQGLLMYNLFDSEPHTTPYMQGTYLGKRRVLNVELGFISQARATWTQTAPDADTVFHSMNLWSGAVYFDSPLNRGRGTAISLYLGYFHYDFGPGYVRYNGIMNPANGLAVGLPGSYGNAFPMFGTGDVLYGQAGYLLTERLLGDGGTLMPYLSIMHAGYDRLREPMDVWAAGVNWLLSDHHAKISLDYQIRPVYKDGEPMLISNAHRGQVVAQYQVYF